MTPADWYKMRCAVLHVGSSLPTDPLGEPSQYASISFVTPQNSTPEAHRYVEVDTRGDKNITLEITSLASEVRSGLIAWFDWLVEPANIDHLKRVRPRLRTIVSARPKMPAEGANPFITWSSTDTTPVVTVPMPRP
jgi:hypothetical protein